MAETSNRLYIIRNYRPADFTEYVQLNKAAETREPAGRPISLQTMAEHLGRPNYSPERDLFIAEMAGKLVGYMDIAPERAIGRVILNCWVHPEHRQRGLARTLLRYAIRRAQELGAKVAHVNIPQDNTVARSTLSRLGFECVRQFLELTLDMAKVHWQDINQASLGCHHLRRGEEDKLTQVQNRSFAGTWGYNPSTVEEITYRINLSHRSPQDVVLAYDGGKVVGYCWTGIIEGGEATTSARKGHIFMAGTDPDYRGRGVGRRVLLAGLTHLKSKGVGVTELTVDSENKVACTLYRSVGFEVRTTSLWYERVID